MSALESAIYQAVAEGFRQVVATIEAADEALRIEAGVPKSGTIVVTEELIRHMVEMGHKDGEKEPCLACTIVAVSQAAMMDQAPVGAPGEV